MFLSVSRRRFLQVAGAAVVAPAIMAPRAHGATESDIDTLMERYIEVGGAPGLSCCVVNRDGLVWSRAAGHADIASDRAMTPDTIQNIGSISKTMTATAVMQLVEEGKLALDEPINKHLPFPILHPKYPETLITVKHLLTHTGTIRDGSIYGESYSCGDPTVSLRDWIRSCLTPDGEHYGEKSSFLRFEPGTRYSYSNIGFGVLGLLVEEVAKKPFVDVTRERIFEPLGMDNTGWRFDEIDVSTHATLYESLELDDADSRGLIASRLPDAGYTELCKYSFPNFPDGLVRTSVNQFADYLHMYLTGGGDVLKSATIDAMLSPQVERRKGSSQGLCWVSPASSDLAQWTHSGGDPGVATIAMIEPQAGTGIAIFTNGPGHEMFSEIYTALSDFARTA